MLVRSLRRWASLHLKLPKVDWNQVEVLPKYPIRFQETLQTSRRSETEIAEFYKAAGLVVDGDETPKPILTFDEWVSHEYLKQVLMEKRFVKPTPIQSAAWPIAIRGRDIVGNVRTGSGKTLAFVLPALQHIQSQPIQRRHEGPIALVLSPTRELAAQTCECFREFGTPYFTKAALFCGGVNKWQQLEIARQGAHVIAATPGRLLDLLASGLVSLKRTTFFVIDEADLLLDMGFEEQLHALLGYLRPDKQTSMWSATMPEEARNLAKEFLINPVYITESRENMSINKDIKHVIHIVHHDTKLELLKQLISTLKLSSVNKLLIFCNRKDNVNYIQQQLQGSVAIHGDMDMQERQSTLKAFQQGTHSIAVATDLAGRGLDFRQVYTVVNYDMPEDLQNYVHRCGRTGRMGQQGSAVTFFTPNDIRYAGSLRHYLDKCQQAYPDQLLQYEKMWLAGRYRQRRAN